MKYIITVGVILCLLLITSCEKGVDSPRGFSLPQGNAELGKQVFIKYQCNGCHQLDDIAQPEDAEFAIKLGGKKTKVKTYAELLTSVINPSHKFARGYPLAEIQQDGKSKMKVFNDVMTVSELINLVTFIQPHYELLPYKTTNYQYYSYR
ncbi:c-type cytochrome [Thalassotalea sp. G2M2-11]|uniref:c-type cytochrome n=1 Tax=Thalassotalea sp. G2M2-11 TaxID=2787627 RepID=UPI0019D1C9AC|nr:c-type cytochrome [Thalassotalea sp. G2M2-11]